MNKSNKKVIILAITFAIITIIMTISYMLFKELNNQLYNETLKFSIEETLLGNHDKTLSKASLYYNLAITSKWIGICSFAITIITFVWAIHIKCKRRNHQ